MYDFFLFDTQVKRIGREDVLIISPDFDVNLRTEDLMVRGGDFYAVWDEDEGLWSTNEQTVTDKEVKHQDDRQVAQICERADA